MRLALDTNILVRFILRDDAGQAAVATEVLQDDCWVSSTVVVELFWVLSKLAKVPRESVCNALDLLLTLPTLRFEKQDHLSWCVERCRAGADLPDMMHIVTCATEVDQFATFDQKLAKQAGSSSPLEITTLRA